MIFKDNLLELIEGQAIHCSTNEQAKALFVEINKLQVKNGDKCFIRRDEDSNIITYFDKYKENTCYYFYRKQINLNFYSDVKIKVLNLNDIQFNCLYDIVEFEDLLDYNNDILYNKMDLIRHYDLNFNLGNAIGYILMAKENNDDKYLLMAKNHLDSEIEYLKKLRNNEV